MAEYTPGERAALEHLGEAVNALAREPRQHPSEMDEFAFFIHGAQTIVMARFTQRHEASGLTPVKRP